MLLPREQAGPATVPTEIVIEAEDRPGMMASLGELLGEAGVNISSLYIAGGRAGDKEMVVAVDDLHRARRGL